MKASAEELFASVESAADQATLEGTSPWVVQAQDVANIFWLRLE